MESGQLQLEYDEVDRELTPLGELVLRHYRADTGEEGYEILIDGAFLMASHGSMSERAMARLAWERLAAPRQDLEVLVGGLGAGHTLRAVLDLDGVSGVVVAEIGAKVVEWNRRYFAAANNRAVSDPRVEVRVTDVAELVAATTAGFDLMLLDVDNGPGWLAAAGNAGLYTADGVASCRRALTAGGVLAVWSPGPNAEFHRTLEQVFPRVEAVDTAPGEHFDGEPGSTIYLART